LDCVLTNVTLQIHDKSTQTHVTVVGMHEEAKTSLKLQCHQAAFV